MDVALRPYNTLLAPGDIAKSVPAPGSVHAAGNATELSLAENEDHAAMHPADSFRAFNKLTRDGLSTSEIAKRHSVPEAIVNRYLRLAAVHPRILKCFTT